MQIKIFDTSILNTMTNKNISIEMQLNRMGISVSDAVRLVLNILDSRDKSSKISPIEFCHKIIDIGKRHIRTKEMVFSTGLSLYINTKQHLRPDSLKDIICLSKRLMKSNPYMAKRNFSELSISDCETWLLKTFSTPSQFNKGRAMLHGLFEFALRREWCDRNPVKLIERRKVIEKEILPLSIEETKRIISVSQLPEYKDCLPAVALLTYAGIRPREVYRLKWRDIDFNESSITIRSQCSKTGGVRSVEICKTLKMALKTVEHNPDSYICVPNWQRRWKSIRDSAGFKGIWIQDVLRHTYASYHAKYYRDLSRLQLNMGHRDQNLLRSRYINMSDITKNDAEKFFMG